MLESVMEFISGIVGAWYLIGGGLLLLVLIVPSIRIIKQNEVGLVIKRFGVKNLQDDSPIAFKGEPGYQATLLMPGWRFKFWITHKVDQHPWVQVPAGQVGVIIAQIGKTLPIGAKSAIYKTEFGNYTNLKMFLENGGEKGVQRHVLPPGTLIPMHPVAFLVVTATESYGVPVSDQLVQKAKETMGKLVPNSFGMDPEKFRVILIKPEEIEIDDSDFDSDDPKKFKRKRKKVDMVGVVTTFEGEPLTKGAIASRLGDYDDVRKLEESDATDGQLVETVLNPKNELHNNYQDFQKFLDSGGRIGLQHDVLLYGAYNLNPFLIEVQKVPMLVVEQGEVAVIKSYVGLATEDVSGEEFKFGSMVKPGHRGIWKEALRTGKFPINPHCYEAVIVPTYILTLNWAEATSKAHKLDDRLKQIDAKSIEGFVFHLDLQVQIHIPDTKAPHVISAVGTVENLVNEVLQAAVGNHFRDKLQSLTAVKFIEGRQEVQEDAFTHIKEKLDDYDVETKGVYIQDVIFPPQLVEVLTEREVAHQEIETFKRQREAQDQRVETEKSKGTADMQAELAKSLVGVDIKKNDANARKAEADGEATYISETGKAQAAEVEAVGMARAKAYKAQVVALGQGATAIVNVATVLSDRNIKIVPEVLVAGGGGSLDGLAATLMKTIASNGLGEAKPKASEEEELTDPARKVEPKEEPVTSKPLEPTEDVERDSVVDSEGSGVPSSDEIKED